MWRISAAAKNEEVLMLQSQRVTGYSKREKRSIVDTCLHPW
jgi:hypothetical protein